MTILLMTFAVALVFAGIGIYALHLARADRPFLNALRGSGTAGAGAPVKVAGVVEDVGAFPAPITGKPSVQAQWLVERESARGHDVLTGQRGEALWLRGEGVRARVDLEAARVEHAQARHETGEIHGEIPARLAALLAEEGIPSAGVVGWTELCIAPGDPLVAIGPAHPIETGEAGVLVLRATSTAELYVTNETAATAAAGLGASRRLALGLGLTSLIAAAVVLVVGLVIAL